MAVRDDVRQLATKKAQAFVPDPNLTPVAPTEFVGKRAPDTRKPNKGLKRFMVGPGGDYGDLADPMWWAKGLGAAAKQTFYDPSKRFGAAIDPSSGASVADRIAGVGEGILYAADLLTPGVPEGAIVRNLQREAMEKALDREVAGYASRGGGARYRGVLGVHGSPVPGLTQIEPRTGSQFMPDTAAAFTTRADMPAYPYDAGRLYDMSAYYARGESSLPIPERKPTIYVTRAPGRPVDQKFPEDMFVSADPVNVVGSVDLPAGKRGLRQAMFGVMTPLEQRKYREAALQRQIDRGLWERDRRSTVSYVGDF